MADLWERLYTQFASPQRKERVEARNREGGPTLAMQGQMMANLRASRPPPAPPEPTPEERSAMRRHGRQALYGEPQTREAEEASSALVSSYQEAAIASRRDALSGAADRAAKAASFYTGAPEKYLRALIRRETANTDDPEVQNPNSSAVGYGQFLDDEHNVQHFRKYAPRYVMGVPDMGDDELMELLRKDGPIAAAMVGHRATQAASAMSAALGRPVTGGEVYIEHFAGMKTAMSVIRGAQTTPNKPATAFFARGQIDANRHDFYERGRTRTVSEFVKHMSAEFGEDRFEGLD